MEPRDFIVIKLIGAFQRGKAGAMQDLVRIGVADAAEDAGIGQRALEGVIFSQEGG